MFREATALDPGVADYWNSLGMVLGGSGQHDEAAARLPQGDRASARRTARYAYNLGLVLMRAGQPEARRRGSAARWRSIPQFAPARQRLAELGR